MPKLDGLEVIRKIKADDTIKNKPVFIVVSAIGEDRIIREAFESGVEYYIMKPMDGPLLTDRIRWALNNEEQRRRSEELKRRNSYTDIEIKLQTCFLSSECRFI